MIHQLFTTPPPLNTSAEFHNSTAYNNNIKNTFIILLFISISTCAQQTSQVAELAREYLLKGEKQKAIELFREAARADENIALIHNDYLYTLVDLSLFDEAQKYLNRVIKRFPDNINYQGDVAWVYFRAGDVARAEKTVKDLIDANKRNAARCKMLADYFTSRSLHQYAIQALLATRREFNSPALFNLELAMLYRIIGQKEQMVDEYLTYVTQDNYNLQYVKNVLQVLLEPADMDVLETKLLQYAQSAPDRTVYTELLIWLYVQQKNFYGALVQARALDRREGTSGQHTAEVAQLAMNNNDYAAARSAYTWILKTFPKGPYETEAKRGLIQTREAALQEMHPVPADSVNSLLADYQQFIAENLPDAVAWEAQRSMAKLYAQWLNNHTKAIELLQQVIRAPQVPTELAAQARLDLGDIYLQNGEWWEAALLYAQAEKAMKETPLGYEGKLRNARLWYFKGDFKLAAEQLDVLKEATSRTIANDAMELSLRIKENLAIDSTATALKALAAAELLLQQNRTNQALELLQHIKQGKMKMDGDTAWVTFTNYAILDDVYWLESQVFLKQKLFDKSIEKLDQIIQEYPNEVLADDALFKKAEVYELHLHDADRARELYLELITRFPGSVHTAEARKRYRRLRGDFAPQQF
jgi:Tfp pilus assembly protein PilF